MGQESFLQWIADYCVAGAILGCLYTMAATLLVIRFARRRSAPDVSPEPVTLLKPLCGEEPGLLGRLSLFCTQAYDAPFQLVFGVQDRSDGAIGVVAALKERFPEVGIDLKVDGRPHGHNRKVSNLANMSDLAQHDLLVLSDSDIEVAPNYLTEVVGALQAPGVGAVTCLYHGVPGAPGIWPQVGALSTNTQFLPNAIVALTLRLARPCFGSTIAIRRETLERIGGFPALADCLADDYELGEAVRATGQEVAIAPGSVGHGCFHATAREFLLHQVRSAKTIKGIDPVGYLGSVITNPLPLALVGLLGGGAHGLAAVAAAIICRSVLCLSVEKMYNLPRQPYWLIPLRDVLEFAVYVASFFGGKVSWKGYRYRVMSDGTLVRDSHLGRS